MANAGTRHDDCGPSARSADDAHDCQCPEHDSEAVTSSHRLDTPKALDDVGSPVTWPAVADHSGQFGPELGRVAPGRPVRTSFAHLSGQEILRALQRFLL